MAEHGYRRSQARPPRQGEGRAHRQTVRKVVDPIADRHHVRQNSLSWGGGGWGTPSLAQVGDRVHTESRRKTLTLGELLLVRVLFDVRHLTGRFQMSQKEI